MSRRLRELGALDALSEIEKQRLYEFTVFKAPRTDSLSRRINSIKSTTYRQYSNRLALTSVDWPVMGDPTCVRLQVEVSGGRLRFEPQYPVKVSAHGEAFDRICDWIVSKTNQVDQPTRTGQSPGSARQALQQESNRSFDIAKGVGTLLPIIAFFRASRQWNSAQPNVMQAATERNSRTDGYSNWGDASLSASALQAWAIAKCLERFQTSSETGVSFDDIHDDELALVNNAISQVVEHAKGLRYDLKQKSLVVEWFAVADSPREPTAFENLSDGQRAIIGLVADIARRMCLLNPQLAQLVTTETPGIVLIDELDMHLHPRWQRLLTVGLQDAFPAVQFIVASHSPQVIGELRPDQIILLRPEGTSHPQVSYRLDSNRVLEEIMGANARTADVEESISKLFTSLERNELTSARQQLDELRASAPGIAELAGAEALLKRKEVLGR